LEVGDGSGCQAKCIAIKGAGEMEGGGRDYEVDVVEAGDHCGGMGKLERVVAKMVNKIGGFVVSR
jgi:hypothetical protein